MIILNNINWKVIIIFLFSITIYSCEKAFEFSPYQVDVDSNKKGTNAIQIKKIQDNDNDNDGNKIIFATISDIHYHYTSLNKIIEHINSDPEIEFLFAVGDITDQGLQKEFELYYNSMEDLNKPYITIIGNHDYRSNGSVVYKQMFGPTNFDFKYKNTHFIGFDDTFWENENGIPEFDWLDNITSTYEANQNKIVIAHLPPFYDQFTPETEEIYTNILNKNKVLLSLHGHSHFHYFGNYYNDSVNYLVNQWIKTPNYIKVTIENKQVNIEKIDL